LLPQRGHFGVPFVLCETTYKAEGFIMAYKWSVGQGEQGDIVYSSDLDQDTKIDFEEDVIKLVANGTEYVTVTTGSTNIELAGDVSIDGAVVFNESSADKDFRVESNNAENMFFIDGANNRIGVGTNQPLFSFDIQERTGVEACIRLKGSADVGIRLAADSDNSGENDNPYIDWYQDGQNSNSRANRLASIAMEGDANASFTDSLANAFFLNAHCPNAAGARPFQIATDQTNGTNKARITIEGSNGYVGVHTNSPSTEMEVIGTTKSDFFATDVTEQDLGSGTSSTLSTTSGLVLLDADSINGTEIGGQEMHILTFPTPSVSGQRLTIIAKNASTNNTMIMPSGLISGSFSGLADSMGVSVLSFVWVSVSGHAAWYQV
jgi:hypothetical protein